MNAYMKGMRNYVTFSGRASRSEYWYFILVYVVLCFVAGFLDGFIHGYTKSSSDPQILSALVHLIHFLPSLAVLVRRLHDTDRTGWWYLAGFTIVGLIPLFIFSVMRGTIGQNRFGPDPVEADLGLVNAGGVRFG
ncbi:DUF805 domain-containing protein [Methylobacterium sp. NEAU 140]|uniref:DUF805 domain-containing protein n=1 Tax=Methylobacterium sp. NEAU 140 TaxID=3064945 RepID=UPI002733B3B2|nr:DUF805 domain-containing protein [Methylobacterium sp. NEAU 140]MDP4022771.1 DUF805 domain-containing protein [Methylobacterium sp. NEAU 140]